MSVVTFWLSEIRTLTANTSRLQCSFQLELKSDGYVCLNGDEAFLEVKDIVYFARFGSGPLAVCMSSDPITLWRLRRSLQGQLQRLITKKYANFVSMDERLEALKMVKKRPKPRQD